MGLLVSTLALICTLFFLAYLYMKRKLNYFRDKNIPYRKCYTFLGNNLQLVLKKESMNESFINITNEFRNVPFVGIFEFSNPNIFIQDPELVKQLGIKEFDSFTNHFVFTKSTSDELFTNSLFLMEDEKWKTMRATLSPAFTGSKMRLMFDLIRKVTENLTTFCGEECDKASGRMTVKPKELFSKVIVDIIATSAFGIEVDSLRDANNEMYKHSKYISFANFKFLLRVIVVSLLPKVAAWLGLSMLPSDSSYFFKKVVADTIAHRKKSNIYRPDVIQLLMEARDGKLKHDSNKRDDDVGFATVHESENMTKHETKRDWTDAEIAGQCFLFFFAGFETISTVLEFASIQLVEDGEVQDKLYQEIRKAKDKLNGEPITYEILMQMQYLDAFVCECLRKYPPPLGIDRMCKKETTINYDDGKTFTIPKGQVVVMNIYGIHYNPKYWPNPGKFDPERFLGENKKKIQPFTFIPFGVGQRACLGSRFALMQIKLIMYHLLANFTFNISEKSVIPMRFKKGMKSGPEGSVVDLMRRESKN